MLAPMPQGGTEGVGPGWSLLDLEASIEHLGRATPQGADLLLVVVEPYYRSLETAARIAPLARELGIPRIGAIANKVRDEIDSRVIADHLRARGVELLAEVPFDEAVREADRRGVAVLDSAPEARSVQEVSGLADRLVGTRDGR